jgi:hypothetical protein
VAIKPDKLSANKQPIADKINDNSNSSSSSRSTSNNMSLMFCSSVQWWAVLIFTWPKTRHFKRTSTGAVIGCASRGDIWRLTCQNNRWIGHYGNCSDGQHIYVSQPTRTGASFIFHAKPLPRTQREVLMVHACIRADK